MSIAGMGNLAGAHAMSGASYSAPPQQKMTNLFNSIDTQGLGRITRAQFAQAFQSRNPPAVFQQQGAAAIFNMLDPNGTGSVSRQTFVSGMSGLMASLRAGQPATAQTGALPPTSPTSNALLNIAT